MLIKHRADPDLLLKHLQEDLERATPSDVLQFVFTGGIAEQLETLLKNNNASVLEREINQINP